MTDGTPTAPLHPRRKMRATKYVAPFMAAFARAWGIPFYVEFTTFKNVHRYVIGKGSEQQVTRDPFRAWHWLQTIQARKIAR